MIDGMKLVITFSHWHSCLLCTVYELDVPCTAGNTHALCRLFS